MSSLIEEIGRERGDQALAGLWSATIAKAAAAVTDLVPVVIPKFDEHLAWGPCRWMPRVTAATPPVTVLPQKGDQALVAYDDTGELWIIVWWPA